jgi:VWFA-related protein
MSHESIVTGISRLGLILLLALPVLPAQKPVFKKGQLFYVVAVRDSRLFTMCAPAAGVTNKGKAKNGEYPAVVQMLPNDMEVIRLQTHQSKAPDPALRENPPYENRVGMVPGALPLPDISLSATLYLPAPVSGSSGGTAPEPGKPDRIELDRVTPDAGLKSEIEKEFQNQKQYEVTDSMDKADFVFLAEGTTIPLEMWTNAAPSANSPRGPSYSTFLGDRKPNLLNAVLGLIVPAQAYRQSSGNPAALLEAMVWEGSSVWEYKSESLATSSTMRETDLNLIPANPGTLVRQFLGKEKIPSNHLPLCAASLETRGMQGTQQNQMIQQGNKPPEVGASMVSVPAVITDTDGKYVSDLNPADFHVFDNNVEQKIERVIPPTDPTDILLMLDTSASTSSAFEEMQRWALAFVDALRPQDRFMVVTFDNRIFVLSDLTGDHEKLRGGIFQMRKGESTRLYDALNLVSADRLPATPGRRAMVLFTDGVDTRSRIDDAEEALGAIERSNMPVFVIRYDTKAGQPKVQHPAGYRPIIIPDGVLENSSLYAFADQYLSGLTEESGGRIYQAKPDDSSDGPVPLILDELLHQYTLCFHPTNTAQDGSLRPIRVSVDRPGVTVRTRTGYRDAVRTATDSTRGTGK